MVNILFQFRKQTSKRVQEGQRSIILLYKPNTYYNMTNDLIVDWNVHFWQPSKILIPRIIIIIIVAKPAICWQYLHKSVQAAHNVNVRLINKYQQNSYKSRCNG